MRHKFKGYRSGKFREVARKNYKDFIEQFNKEKKNKELEKSFEEKDFLQSIQEIFLHPF